MEPLKLRPAFQDYIWGGTKLRTEFGKECDYERIAESWELSCHPAGLSTIATSIYRGMTLQQYLEQDWAARVGEGAANFSSFPVLIKLIDAQQDLSVQVHPDDRYAREHENGENGKTECWYVVDCEEGAALAYGFNRELTKEEFRAHIQDGTLLDYVRLVPVKKGDVFFIEAGTLHAIGAGMLIAEIQQNSNITYRVYDYERVGADGKPRELHIDKAVDVTKTWSAPPRMKRPPQQMEGYEIAMIADCPYFTAWELHVTEEAAIPAPNGESYVHLIVTEGEAALVYDEGVVMPLSRGESVFIPANFGAFSIRSKDCTLLMTRTLPKEKA